MLIKTRLVCVNVLLIMQLLCLQKQLGTVLPICYVPEIIHIHYTVTMDQEPRASSAAASRLLVIGVAR